MGETTSASFLERQEGSLFAQAHTTETDVIDRQTSLILNRLQRGQTSMNRLVLQHGYSEGASTTAAIIKLNGGNIEETKTGTCGK